MKFTALALVAGVAAKSASASQDSPVTRVVQLLKGLQSEIEADGKAEQASYDKYACWCEDTTARKVSTISKARTDIEDLSSKIVDYKGKIATLAADIKQAEKDIAANILAQEEATSLRKKEHGEYAGARVEAEQAHGALDSAIKVLSGAGEGKGEASLVAMRQASVLSIVSGVRTALRSLPRDSLSEEDMEALQAFLANPTGQKKAFLQSSNNPFGDYAPASTQIQGILKDMFDTFAGDLQEMNTNEGKAQKSFEELIATKQTELDALEATLSNKKASHGKAVKGEADAQMLRDETQALLKAAEEFLAETKKNCATKADEWATRTRLRTEELGGIMKATEILESGSVTFETSATTFVQLSQTAQGVRVGKALSKVRSMATHSKSLRLASLGVKIRMAAEAMSGGKMGNSAFKQVLGAIDAMIVELRKEGQDDIDHKDRCQRAQNGNANENEDLQTRIEKLTTEIKRLNGVKDQLRTDITTAETDITSTETDMQTALDLRNEELQAHKDAMKADREAVQLIGKAIGALAKFYESNKIALAQQPAYSTSEDDAPETTFKNADYGGRKSENTGIVAILGMIKEDIEKEMSTAAKEDAESNAAFLEEKNAMQNSLDALNQKKANLETQEAETGDQIADRESEKQGSEGNKAASEEEKEALATSCAWVESHFESRADKRKSEIAGLQEAKSFLMGSEF